MKRATVGDYESIYAVVSKYVEGCALGSSAVMKPAFYSKAIMHGYLNGALSTGPIQNLYDIVDKLGPAVGYKVRVDIISVEATVACVHVVLENWHGLTFADLHQLLKVDGEWKIISKVFHQYDD